MQQASRSPNPPFAGADGRHHYWLHGLRIASTIELPELRPRADDGRDDADVLVDHGDLPPAPPQHARRSDDMFVDGDAIMFSEPTVGRFVARGGRTLHVQPARGASVADVRIYLMGSGLGAILHQRGMIPLHACAIAHEGGCACFVGDSGAGKSTLAAMLARRGYRLLSDDVLALGEAPDGAVTASPGAPIIKLWPQSMQAASMDGADAPFESADFHKHRVRAPELFDEAAAPITRVYVLRWLSPATASPEIAPLGGLEALMALRANVYRPHLVTALERERAFMMTAQKLLSRARVFEFRRARNLAQGDAQIDALLAHLRS